MEDDNEVLDWGHEDEDSVVVHGSEQRSFAVDDPEDAVSLGGDEEDEFLTYQTRVPQHAGSARSPPRRPRQDHAKTHSGSPRTLHSRDHSVERTGSVDLSAPSGRATLVHALPPKPVVSTVPFVHPSHPSIIEATAMVSRVDRDRRNGAPSKPGMYDHNDSLPPGWEVKYSRSGRGVYYYNIHTQESTWTRPAVPPPREKRGERSDRRDDSLDKPLSTRNDVPRVGRTDSGDMSYNDRHYRPGETARREERQPPSPQLIDSYVPDSYSPDRRDARPSPPPPRAKDRDSTPPPRRPLSSAGSYGDRDGVQNSHHEAPLAPLSSQDRVWVARDSVPHAPPRERRQRDDPPPPELDRRILPRDTERSSTTRPKSPASYTRGPQESANLAPLSISKPTQPPSEPPSRKSRFSQPDGSHHNHRQPESRETGLRRARTDDAVSHSTRYVDDIPSSRSMSDARGDDDIPTYPASDAQRPGSRKRIALPSQDEAYRPGARPPPAQRGGVYPSGPIGPLAVSVPENRHASRVVPDDMLREPARRSPSPPPPLAVSGLPPTERDDRDRGRSRWSKPRANGPPPMDSQPMHESSRSRVHDTTMDVDDLPLTRSSDPPPTKQMPPRRPALQDEVPRYPRAMLNSDNDGPPRGVRDNRDAIESRYRFAPDEPRFGPSRDRPTMERRFADQSAQKEPIQGVETKHPPPPGSNIKLSGTNNIPIGARHKFAGNVPPGPVSMSPSGLRRLPSATIASNGEPVAPRRERVDKDHERPPHLDPLAGDRPTQMGPVKREDGRQSPILARPIPQTEPPPPAPPPTRPSRAELRVSRFGPPIVKENTEPVIPQKSVSSESAPSEQIPEGSTRATPPPPSRESSMASFKDMALAPSRPTHLPPRPTSPPRSFRQRLGDTSKPYYRPNARSPPRANDVDMEPPLHPRPSSPPPRKHVETHPPEPVPASRDDRDHEVPRLSVNLREPQMELIARPPASPVLQDESLDRTQHPIHPERALMLQVNGLPPRPLGALGGARSIKVPNRRDDRDHDRAEPLRGNSSGQFHSTSPSNERRQRFPDAAGPRSGGSSGASLLDRLSFDDGSRIHSPSLRERVQLPFKRDRDEMVGDVVLDEGDEYDGMKRVRRRGGPRPRRGRV